MNSSINKHILSLSFLVSSFLYSQELYRQPPPIVKNSEAGEYILKALAAYPAIKALYNYIENRIPIDKKTRTAIGIAANGTVNRKIDTDNVIKTQYKGWKISPEFEYDLDTYESKISIAFSLNF